MSSPAVAPQPPEIPGLTRGRFLASGGYADVFCYQQQRPLRDVAVKVLAAGDNGAAAREQFRNEGDAMARLAGHSNILTVFWAGTAGDDRPYLVMEYCQPPNLGLRATRSRLSATDVLRHGVQLCGAVETVHRAGLLHRDIKPANILVGRNGMAKLTDFGISAPLSLPPGEEPEGISIPWSPHEVLFASAPADARSDVHSLAATLYSLLAGRSPFEVPGGDNQARALMERVDRGVVAPTGRADVPVSLERLLAQALSRDPAARPASAEAFGWALQGIERELNLTPTILELPDTQLVWQPSPADAEDRTRIKAPVTIHAQRPAAAASESVSVAAEHSPLPRERVMPSALVLDKTGRRPQVDPTPPQPAAAPPDAGGRRSGLLVGAGLLVVAVLAVAGVALALHHGGAQTPRPVATQTQDALPADADPVPTPAVTATRTANAVQFSWVYDDPAAGDAFLVRRLDTTSGPAQRLTEARLSITAAAGVRPCIEVRVVRGDGRVSQTPGQACAP